MFDVERQRFETSMYRIMGLSGDEIRRIAQTEIVEKTGRPVLARGDIRVGMIHKHDSLRLVADEPPPQHAVIIGWPGTPDEGKDRRMSLQDALARDAVLQRLDAEPKT